MDLSPALLQRNLRLDLEEVLPNGLSMDCPLPLCDSPLHAAIVSAMGALCKKWVPHQGTRELRNRALHDFLVCNERCAEWTRTQHPLYSRVLDEMRHLAFIHFSNVDISWDAIFTKGRNGPGASVGSRGNNSSLEKSFLNRLSTYSVPLYKAYGEYTAKYFLLGNAEKHRLQRLGNRAIRVVAGSTAGTVRKNSGTDRVVLTEASLNMQAQLGLGEIINDVLLAEYGFDSAFQQDRNRELARRGSRSNNIATVDLTSSSDLIAWLLTQDVLPVLLSAAISDIRADRTKVDGKYVELHMVSSMGNGFTFPLMTYLYSLLLEALCKVLGSKFQRFDAPGTHFGVFGDDICAPTRLYEPLCGTLEALGFVPNLEKSFHNGKFRESCGADWFDGYPVRGVYVKRLECQSDYFSALNRFNLWSARHLVPLQRTARALMRSGWRSYAIPSDVDLSLGVMTPVAPGRPLSGLYCYKQLKYVDTKVAIYRYKKGTIIGLRRRFDNPFGVLACVIQGSLRGGCVTRRQRDRSFDEEECRAPFWNRDKDFAYHGVALGNWETMSALNLRWFD